MKKTYVVQLSNVERHDLEDLVKKGADSRLVGIRWQVWV